MKMEVVKEYEYERDGRKVCIRRAYNVKGTKHTKQCELDEYFKNNAETIKSCKKLNNVLDDYNNKHDNKISFSMLYQKYKTIFGPRKNQSKSSFSEESDSNSEVLTYIDNSNTIE